MRRQFRARPFNDTYGAHIEVYGSSATSGPCVWVSAVSVAAGLGAASIHLNPRQARALIARLQAWLKSEGK